MAKFCRSDARANRSARIRKKIVGTPERPRLAVFKSNRYLYCQVIDDSTGNTIVSVSSLEKDLREKCGSRVNIGVAEMVGKLIGERAKGKGISKVVFDRGGNLYHGRIKALADAARSAGLEF